MSIFGGKKRFGQYGLFEGCTDYHCHILPGVDDGIRTVNDALAVLSEYENAGVSKVWLTPHVMEDMPNRTEDLKNTFDELCAAYCGPLALELASENMLDNLFEKRLESGDFLPLEGDRLLVETSYFNPPMDLKGLLSRVRSAGYNPVLAHPERYMYMETKDYYILKSEGVLFQLNIPSLLGFYGNTVRKKAEKLLENNMYDLAGTDLHRVSMFGSMLDSRIGRKAAGLLSELVKN